MKDWSCRDFCILITWNYIIGDYYRYHYHYYYYVQGHFVESLLLPLHVTLLPEMSCYLIVLLLFSDFAI